MKETRIIDLGRKLTLSTVDSVQCQLADAVVYRMPVVFKADEVEFVDAASLQLIHSFRTLLKVRGMDATWHAPSAQLVEISLLLGFAEKLEIPLSRPKQYSSRPDVGVTDLPPPFSLPLYKD